MILPSTDRSTRPLKIGTLLASETRKLPEAARGDKLEALHVLALTTEMRQGELLALEWQDTDLENTPVSVRPALSCTDGRERVVSGETETKKSRRTIHLTGAAVQALRGCLDRRLSHIERLATCASSSPARPEPSSTRPTCASCRLAAPDEGGACALSLTLDTYSHMIQRWGLRPPERCGAPP